MAGAPHLLSSKPGAEAVLRLLGVASAKLRKEFCRDLKGKFAALASNAVDYVVIIRLATTVDDTVMLVKGMMAELIQALEELCFDKYGHKVLAWLLRPEDAHLFSPFEIQCAALPSPASIKAPETRRQELVRTIKPPLRSLLLKKSLEVANDLHAKDLLAAYLAADWDAELVESILSACEAEASKGDFSESLLNTGTVTTALIVLLKLQPEKAEKGSQLAEPLWRRCLEPHLVSAATSRCAFVLLDLLKRGGSLKESVLSALKSKKKEIESACAKIEASGGQAGGARKLLSEAS
eukprot:TRINITY_DN1491_c1_g2_i1.p1 TRINITY_DN1491_c1_g2~~TRINITY_DN1491_c1_g2_i1.p1  ORF type:complete len:294 (-),score=79.89 TRINITY_DN1491_c1_g2_i1:116-997(-)